MITRQLAPLLLCSAIALCAAPPAATAEDAPATTPAAAPQAPAATTDAPSSESAWLGVATKRLPRIASEHLGLMPGAGLSVEMVVDDSPAATAGIRKDDVLARFDDQKLMLPEQLATLIQSCKPGQVAKLGVIRDGSPLDLTVTLAPRPAGFAATAPARDDDARDLLHSPDPGFDTLNDMLRGMMQGGNPADMDKNLQRMREQVERMQREMLENQPQGGFNMQVFRLDEGRIQVNDNKGSITVEKNNGKMTLTAKDKDGKVMFEGPYETDEEKAKVPDDIRKRMGRMDFKIGGGIQFGGGIQLGGGIMPDDQDAPADNAPAPEPRIDGAVNPGDRVD